MVRGWTDGRPPLWRAVWLDGADGLLPVAPGGPVTDRAAPPAEGDQAGLDELADAVRLEQLQQRLQLGRAADGLDGDHVGGQVDRLGLEQTDDLDQLTAGLRGRPDLHQGHLAAHGGVLEL